MAKIKKTGNIKCWPWLELLESLYIIGGSIQLIFNIFTWIFINRHLFSTNSVPDTIPVTENAEYRPKKLISVLMRKIKNNSNSISNKFCNMMSIRVCRSYFQGENVKNWCYLSLKCLIEFTSEAILGLEFSLWQGFKL